MGSSGLERTLDVQVTDTWDKWWARRNAMGGGAVPLGNNPKAGSAFRGSDSVPCGMGVLTFNPP